MLCRLLETLESIFEIGAERKEGEGDEAEGNLSECPCKSGHSTRFGGNFKEETLEACVTLSSFFGERDGMKELLLAT